MARTVKLPSIIPRRRHDYRRLARQAFEVAAVIIIVFLILMSFLGMFFGYLWLASQQW